MPPPSGRVSLPPGRRPGILAAALLAGLTATVARAQDVPDVHFAVIRMNYQYRVIEGYYEFSQPFRKSLPPAKYLPIGNFHYRGTEVLSRLTGQRVMQTYGDVWDGWFAFPSSGYQHDVRIGFDPPLTPHVNFLLRFSSAMDAMEVWNIVRETNVIDRIASRGRYEVAIFDVSYGGSATETPEWIIVAQTIPRAPRDAAIEDVLWPRGLVSQNECTVPEVRLHNFSDVPEEMAVQIRVTGPGGVVHEETRVVGTVAQDASVVVPFDPIVIDSPDPLTFQYQLVDAKGNPTADAHSDNDLSTLAASVSNLPVFRAVATSKTPGTIPLSGTPHDIDGDGDVDILQWANHPRLWRRGADGSYVDVTASLPVALGSYPSQSLCEDFNGDGHPDLLVMYTYEPQPPAFLLGDGAGGFTDATLASGLWPIRKWGAEPVDKDLDGDLDLVFLSDGPEIVMENNGSGVFTDVSSTAGLVHSGGTTSVTSGDLNNDGWPDLFVTGWGNLSRLYVNDGTGRFESVPESWTFTYGRDTEFFDYDHDGDLDILFLHLLYDDPSHFLRNNGDLTFTDVSVEVGLTTEAFHADVADIDGDGHQDVLLLGLDGMTLFMGQGAAGFVDRTEILVDLIPEGGSAIDFIPWFVDLDEDGDTDIYSKFIAFENTDGTCTVAGVPDLPENPPMRLRSYPNPFNPARGSARIHYGVEETGPVRLLVMDVRGRKVRTLVERPHERGDWFAEWNGRTDAGRIAPSGVYFYVLESPGRKMTGRIHLVN